MPVLQESRSERLLRAVLDLSAVTRGALSESALADRILRATQAALAVEEVRVGLVKGRQLVGFSPERGFPSRPPARLRRLELGPVVEEWLGRAGASDEPVAWPRVIAEALELDPAHAVVAPLGSARSPLGLLAAGVEGPADEIRADLAVLAAHAGTVVANAHLYRRLEEEAETDGLTGAYNYRFFMRAVAREMDRVQRGGRSFAVLMVDVDNLKDYNDRFGHLGGSAALKEMAELMRVNTRSVDVVCKYGGDEFSLLLIDCDEAGAIATAERLREMISAHLFEGDAQRRLTVSMGLAVYTGEGTDPRSLLRAADTRLYEAKRSGRNRVGSSIR